MNGMSDHAGFGWMLLILGLVVAGVGLFLRAARNGGDSPFSLWRVAQKLGYWLPGLNLLESPRQQITGSLKPG